ncbi:MAG TPA: hypothetical protein VGM43_01320 [Bryobacteraceae bacterium]|jgi:hypothetical protein
MAIAGLAVTLLGFLIALSSLSMTDSVTGRLIMVLIGIVVSLGGIFGLLNTAYLKNAIWRK